MNKKYIYKINKKYNKVLKQKPLSDLKLTFD